MKLQTFLFFLILSTIMVAQSTSWKSYTSMREVVDVAKDGNTIWAGTMGGLFSYDTSTDTYQKYTRSEGLSSHSITAINIDNDKNIIIGSQDGYINILNPVTNEIKELVDIVLSDQNNKEIYDILISGDKAYLATDFGVVVLNTTDMILEDTFRKFGDFTTEIPVYDIVLDNNGLLYVLTQEGIAMQKQGFGNLTAPEAWNVLYTAQSEITSSAKLNQFNNSIYFSIDNFLYSINSTQQVSIEFTHNVNITDFNYINENEFYYIDEDYNYYHYENGAALLVSFNETPEEINSFMTDDDGEVIFYGNQGIYINGYPLKQVIPNGPYQNYFADVVVDKHGEVWGSSGESAADGGLMHFNGSEWNAYNRYNTEGIVSNSVNKLYVSDDDSVYMSMYGAGFSTFKDGAAVSYYPNAGNIPLVGDPDNTRYLIISQIQHDSQGNLWVLNYRPAHAANLNVRKPDGSWMKLNARPPVPTSLMVAYDMLIDANDTKWFIVRDGSDGLYYYNEQSTLEDLSDDVWNYIRSGDPLPSGLTILSMKVDKRNEMWIGTTNGCYTLPNINSPRSQYTTVYSTRGRTVNCIEVDAVNNKWIGTTQGVYVLNSDGSEILANYTVDNSPIPNDNILEIEFDDERGIAYIATASGLTGMQTTYFLPGEEFEELEVFPNPFIAGQDERIAIDGLKTNAEVKILSIDGRLIREITGTGSRRIYWDGRRSDGNLVNSGVYIIVAFDPETNDTKTAKVAVVKK